MITCPNSNTGSERFERLNVNQGEPGRDRLPVGFRAAPPRGCSSGRGWDGAVLPRGGLCSGVRGRGGEVVGAGGRNLPLNPTKQDINYEHQVVGNLNSRGC